jgi:uncharacterized membrane protein
MPAGLTTAAFALHIAGGFVALVAGYLAIFAPKGGRTHRAAGKVFLVAMLVMGAFAAALAVVRPGQLVNLFIATLALYLVTTSWLAASRGDGRIGNAERGLMVVSLVLWAPFAVLAFQLAAGLPPFFKSVVAFKGAVLIAIYAFTGVLGIAALSDVKVVVQGTIAGPPRIARHLWHMCLGLTLATGSAFTNGFARLLPGPYHVPVAFFLPQFLPVLLLAFWLVRVRLPAARSWRP